MLCAGGNEITGSSTSVDMDTGAQIDGSVGSDKRRLRTRGDNIRWDEWHTHRIDWTEGMNSWFIDGEHYLDKTYSVPTVPSYFVMVVPLLHLHLLQNRNTDPMFG